MRLRKKTRGFILLCMLFLSHVNLYAEENLDLYARSAVLMDGDSGRVLYGKMQDEMLPMASTTKIMTCILALENGDLQQVCEVSSLAEKQPQVKLGMKQGEHYYLKDLLYSMMLESHNDSAVCIAENVSGDLRSFIRMMNDKAVKIGCLNTWFVTPNGLDKIEGMENTRQHVTTAKDLARIMRYCLIQSEKKEVFLEITKTPEYSFWNLEHTNRTICNNHNVLLTRMEGALSGKTGYTGKAGYCYVGAVKREGKLFIVSLLACGWPGHRNYKWSDTDKLINFGEENYEQCEVFLKRKIAKNIQVKRGKDDQLLISDKIIRKTILLSKEDHVSIVNKMTGTIEAPVRKGDKLGEITCYVNGELIWNTSILSENNVRKTDYTWYFLTMISRFLVLS